MRTTPIHTKKESGTAADSFSYTLKIPPNPFTIPDTCVKAFIICPVVFIILLISILPSCDLNEFNIEPKFPPGGFCI